jgi:hypothetical protein
MLTITNMATVRILSAISVKCKVIEICVRKYFSQNYAQSFYIAAFYITGRDKIISRMK